MSSQRTLEWAVIPGRKVAHRFRPSQDGHWWFAACGTCRRYTAGQLREAARSTRRCEQCLIEECAQRSGLVEKFVYGRILSPRIRRMRRVAWRAYRLAHGLVEP